MISDIGSLVEVKGGKCNFIDFDRTSNRDFPSVSITMKDLQEDVEKNWNKSRKKFLYLKWTILGVKKSLGNLKTAAFKLEQKQTTKQNRNKTNRKLDIGQGTVSSGGLVCSTSRFQRKRGRKEKWEMSEETIAGNLQIWGKTGVPVFEKLLNFTQEEYSIRQIISTFRKAKDTQC